MKVVLLSGGIGSTAALHQARLASVVDHEEVRAFFFMYGQPAQNAEMFAARTIAERNGVPCQTILLPEIRQPEIPRRLGWSGQPRHIFGLYELFVLRALVDVTPDLGERVSFHLGGTTVSPNHLYKRSLQAIVKGVSGAQDATIVTPFLDQNWRMWDVLSWCSDKKIVMADLAFTASCFRGTRCLDCQKCIDRRNWFTKAGEVDPASLQGLPRMTGGDPARDAVLTR